MEFYPKTFYKFFPQTVKKIDYSLGLNTDRKIYCSSFKNLFYDIESDNGIIAIIKIPIHVPITLNFYDNFISTEIYIKEFVDFKEFLQTRCTQKKFISAVKHIWNTLKYIPEHLKTPELCLIAVRRSYGSALQYVPEHLKTPELCLIAIEQDGSNLKYVPAHLKTPELCLIAVAQDESALQYALNI